MIDLIWHSMKQQNMMHHVIFIVVNIGLIMLAYRYFRKTGPNSLKRKRVLFLLVLALFSLAWLGTITWAAEAYWQEQVALEKYPFASTGTILIKSVARGLLGGIGAWILTTILRKKDTWEIQ